MPGPQRYPTVLKELKGTKRNIRTLDNELTFSPLDSIPESPEGFDEKSKLLWLGCCTSLMTVGLLFAQDIPLLEQYVYCVFMIRESRMEIMNSQVINTQTNKAGHEYQSINKWVGINLEYSKEANRLGREFGFSPSARTKIAMGQPKQTDPLDDIL